MSVVLESRREFFGLVSGAGLLSSLAGCTAVGTVTVDIRVENTGTEDERAEYYIERGASTTGAKTIDLEAGGDRTVSAELERGDVVVVSKGDLGYECTLNGYVCRNPTLQIDIGHGALGMAGECFDISPQ